jgi:hypothetical protein
MYSGPGRRDIRARSVTLVVCVAENSMDCRFSGISLGGFGGLTSWKNFDNLLHLLLEPNLQDTIRLVDDQRFKVFENKSFRVLASVTPFSPTHLQVIQ